MDFQEKRARSLTLYIGGRPGRRAGAATARVGLLLVVLAAAGCADTGSVCSGRLTPINPGIDSGVMPPSKAERP